MVLLLIPQRAEKEEALPPRLPQLSRVCVALAGVEGKRINPAMEINRYEVAKLHTSWTLLACSTSSWVGWLAGWLVEGAVAH